MNHSTPITDGVSFLQWALPRLGYRWEGFRKPREQVLKRIRRRMQELQLSGGFREYASYLESHPEEWKRLDRFCYVTVSKFFRDRKLWDFLRDEVLAELIQRESSEPLRFWSAGCCNGEEPYSISIIYDQLGRNMEVDRPLEILATDRNEEVLKRARKGWYPRGTLKELTKQEMDNYFTLTDHEEDPYRIKADIQEPVRFEQRDIREHLPDQIFELVFCRSLVFTYFDHEFQEEFLAGLRPRLAKNGYLIIGGHEEMPEVDWLEAVSGTHPVYRKC